MDQEELKCLKKHIIKGIIKVIKFIKNYHIRTIIAKKISYKDLHFLKPI